MLFKGIAFNTFTLYLHSFNDPGKILATVKSVYPARVPSTAAIVNIVRFRLSPAVVLKWHCEGELGGYGTRGARAAGRPEARAPRC